MYNIIIIAVRIKYYASHYGIAIHQLTVPFDQCWDGVADVLLPWQQLSSCSRGGLLNVNRHCSDNMLLAKT